MLLFFACALASASEPSNKQKRDVGGFPGVSAQADFEKNTGPPFVFARFGRSLPNEKFRLELIDQGECPATVMCDAANLL